MSHLTQEQRYTIAVLKKEKRSQTYISKEIGVHKSTVSRELKRNKDGRSGEYKADLATKKCKERHTIKAKKVRLSQVVKDYISECLQQHWSPQQMVGRAKRDSQECVSTERIYQHLWADKKAGGSLYKHLRNQGKRYRKRGSTKDKRGCIVGRVGIEKRPEIVAQKERMGDLEIDLVIGEHHQKALLTINDRLTNKAIIRRVESKEASEIEKVLVQALTTWKWVQTITSDNGKEFANHVKIAETLKVKYYFANPYCSWERGANENMNGLIRQYFPKKSSFLNITHEEIQKVEDEINNRPRKKFGYATPNEVHLQTINNNGQKVAFMT